MADSDPETEGRHSVRGMGLLGIERRIFENKMQRVANMLHVVFMLSQNGGRCYCNL